MPCRAAALLPQLPPCAAAWLPRPFAAVACAASSTPLVLILTHPSRPCPPLPLVPAADDKDNAALYVRFMKKAVEKGVEWVTKEVERLTKMAEKPMSGGWRLAAGMRFGWLDGSGCGAPARAAGCPAASGGWMAGSGMHQGVACGRLCPQAGRWRSAAQAGVVRWLARFPPLLHAPPACSRQAGRGEPQDQRAFLLHGEAGRARGGRAGALGRGVPGVGGGRRGRG